jgi:hypothetical protein
MIKKEYLITQEDRESIAYDNKTFLSGRDIHQIPVYLFTGFSANNKELY